MATPSLIQIIADGPQGPPGPEPTLTQALVNTAIAGELTLSKIDGADGTLVSLTDTVFSGFGAFSGAQFYTLPSSDFWRQVMFQFQSAPYGNPANVNNNCLTLEVQSTDFGSTWHTAITATIVQPDLTQVYPGPPLTYSTDSFIVTDSSGGVQYFTITNNGVPYGNTSVNLWNCDSFWVGNATIGTSGDIQAGTLEVSTAITAQTITLSDGLTVGVGAPTSLGGGLTVAGEVTIGGALHLVSAPYFAQGVTLGMFTVATLPSLPAGSRAFVSDSSVPAMSNFGVSVAGGGTNLVPVYFDSVAWRIG